MRKIRIASVGFPVPAPAPGHEARKPEPAFYPVEWAFGRTAGEEKNTKRGQGRGSLDPRPCPRFLYVFPVHFSDFSVSVTFLCPACLSLQSVFSLSSVPEDEYRIDCGSDDTDDIGSGPRNVEAIWAFAI